MEEKEPEMAFCRIDTFDARARSFSSILLREKMQQCLSYPIYEPLPILHTIVMFVLSLYAFLF